MTGSPFSNVVGHDSDSSNFQNVEATQGSDTTTETGARPADNATEPAPGVEGSAGQGATHVAGQDETGGQAPSGTETATQ